MSSPAARFWSEYTILDPKRLLFSFNSFLAAAVTLGITFAVSLPRPWWALLTVYVTAQPLSGAFRPKVIYRLGGIAIGAAISIVVVPNLQNSPPLMVFCLAVWTGFCIYLAVLDRTPRAFLFQMAAFSSAVISFPYIYDPAGIFMAAVSRVEEMTIAILSVTFVHTLLQPWSVRQAIRVRAQSFLALASRWTAEALRTRHTALEHKHRRALAADVTELGMIATNLRLEHRYALATSGTVVGLQHSLARTLPLASAAANRLDHLRALDAVDDEVAGIVDAAVDWLTGSADTPDELDQALVTRCRVAAAERVQRADWPSLLAANLFGLMADFMAELHRARVLVRHLDETEPAPTGAVPVAAELDHFPLVRDYGLAALAGVATATAVILYCTVWILLEWPDGVATAAFAALITNSFIVQDDPAPVIGRYLAATLSTFPLAAFYLFIVLPRVDGYGMLVLTLAPALIWMGYIQADPARSARALPMFSCFIVAMGFVDRFNADFAQFVNTGLAQVGGIVTPLLVSRLFRSVNVRWRTWQIIRGNWLELERLADPGEPMAADAWTARATDRLGQIAARMAVATPYEELRAADGLSDLRIGRNLIQIRRGSEAANDRLRRAVNSVLEEVSALFRNRLRAGEAIAASDGLLTAIDGAIDAATHHGSGMAPQALLALVGMRCNLFPKAQPFEGAA